MELGVLRQALSSRLAVVCEGGMGIMDLAQLGLQLEENMVGSHSCVPTNSR